MTVGRRRYRVVRDGLACPDPARPWAVVDGDAGGLVVKWCASEDEAELTADLYETGEPVGPI